MGGIAMSGEIPTIFPNMSALEPSPLFRRRRW
jgi:hypothetical protein